MVVKAQNPLRYSHCPHTWTDSLFSVEVVRVSYHPLRPLHLPFSSVVLVAITIVSLPLERGARCLSDNMRSCLVDY